MLANYVAVWNEIKKVGSAEITVHKDRVRTVEDGIKHAKSAENVARRMAGLVGWSKLIITRHTISATHVRIRFELLYLTSL